jgi:hypothetical protein
MLERINRIAQEKKVDPTTAFGRAWLLDKVGKLTPNAADRAQILKDRDQQRNKVMIGRMYFYFYNPKTKAKLPYWDLYPIVIPIEPYNDGFLGLNLHYIYPKDRLILLNQLRNFVVQSKNHELTRLRLSYPILKAYSLAYRATPCIKRYLRSHVMSRYVEIEPCEWDIAAALPMQDFRSHAVDTEDQDRQDRKKKERIAAQGRVTKEQVWKESKEKY